MRLSHVLALNLALLASGARADDAVPVADAPVAAVPAPRAPMAEKQARPFSLTISGGISRGAYEAGVNWSIVTALRATRTPSNPLDWQARLDVITGASAGTINTFLSALTWCRPEVFTELPTESLFWKAWVPISYGALFQDDLSKVGYDDALFSRGAFQYAIDVVGEEIAGAAFRENCSVQLGTTLTPARAERLKATNRALEVPAMRFIVPLEMHVGADNTPRFYNLGERPRASAGESGEEPGAAEEIALRLDALSTQGPRWQLPEERGGDISLQNVFSLNYASSAFPAAFGHVCVPGVLLDEKGVQIGAESVCHPEEPARCDTDPDARCRFFLDGGVFDNVPLFLAVALADQDVRPVYIDPELRRGLPEDSHDAKMPFRARGLGAVVGMLQEAVPAARSYELQFYLRNDSPKDDSALSSSLKAQQARLLRSTTGRELLSDRYAPIVGETMLSFGAFFLKEFRAYDFHAGTYDGIVSMARYIACGDRPGCDGASLPLAEIVPSLGLVIGTLTGTAERAGLEGDPSAVAVIHMMFDDEFAGDPALAAAKAFLPRDPTAEPDALIVALARASLEMRKEDVAARGPNGQPPADAKDCGLVGRSVDTDCRLARLVKRVVADESIRFDRRIQTSDCEEQGFFAKAAADTCPPWRRRELEHAKRFLRPGGFVPWFEGEALKIVARAADIEQRDIDTFEKKGNRTEARTAAIASANSTRRAAVVLDAALRTNAIFDSVGLFTPSSSLSGWPALLLPQRAMIDIAGGTVSPVWRPWTGKPCRWFGVSLDLEPLRVDVNDLFYEPAAALAPRVALWPDGGLFLEARAGPAYRFASGALYDDQSLGLDITGELVIFHKLRIGGGVRHWTLASASPAQDVMVLLGVDDISGIVAMFVR